MRHARHTTKIVVQTVSFLPRARTCRMVENSETCGHLVVTQSGEKQPVVNWTEIKLVFDID